MITLVALFTLGACSDDTLNELEDQKSHNETCHTSTGAHRECNDEGGM